MTSMGRRPPLLIDAVIVNDELELLELRLDLLSQHVDHVVIAESRETFAGMPKPLHVADNIDRYVAHLDRMTIIEYEMPGAPDDRWQRERTARDALVPAVRALAPDGVMLLCDVDEFPSAEQCEAARRLESPASVPMVTYYRRGNWRLESETPILVAKAIPVRAVPDRLETLRWDRSPQSPQIPGEAGAHFSYMGFTAGDLRRKYAAFSHGEVDFPAASSTRLLALSDWARTDHLGRVRSVGRGLLAIEPPEHWSTLQRALYGRRPDWFDTGRAPASSLARHWVAAVADAVVQERRADLADILDRPSRALHPKTIKGLFGPTQDAVRRWRWERATSSSNPGSS